MLAHEAKKKKERDEIFLAFGIADLSGRPTHGLLAQWLSAPLTNALLGLDCKGSQPHG